MIHFDFSLYSFTVDFIKTGLFFITICCYSLGLLEYFKYKDRLRFVNDNVYKLKVDEKFRNEFIDIGSIAILDDLSFKFIPKNELGKLYFEKPKLNIFKIFISTILGAAFSLLFSLIHYT